MSSVEVHSVEVHAGTISHSRPWITAADREAVADALREGMIAAGTRRAALEQALTRELGAAAVTSCGSGTAALVLALKSLGVAAGDEVILPTYVCSSVSAAVRAAGGTPVLCDVSDDWTMSPDDVRVRLTSRTAAIILVHLFGIRVDPAPFLELGVPVIEDSCQAFGAPVRPDLPRGAFEVFSFHATKCLTTGEGGAVAAYEEPWRSRLQEQVAAGAVPAPLSDMQAALGLSQLGRYAEFLRLRREHAAAYSAALPPALVARIAARSGSSMFFRFPLWLPDGKSFREALDFFAAAGIAVRRGVDRLLHTAEGLPDSGFPGALECYRRTLSVPLWPGLHAEERQRIIMRTHEYVEL